VSSERSPAQSRMERLGKPRHGREDHRLSEWEVSESNRWSLTTRDVSTPLDMTSNLLEDRRTVWAVAAVSFLLFLIGNLPWQLDDYDQAKQAYTSLGMIKEGRWFYQQTPHERVATKPPLVGWVSAGPLRNNSVMGGSVAAAIAPGCHCAGGLAVSRCQLRLRIDCRSRCV
jgi:hypothetical protein